MQRYGSCAAMVLLGIVSTIGVSSVIRGVDAATPGDIAIISAQRIRNESTEAKAANGRLDTLRQSKATELAEKQKALEATHQQLAQQGGLFSASKRAKVQADEDRQRAELKQASEQAGAEYQALQRQVQADLGKHLGAVVASLAKERRLRLVLNSDVIVWAAPGMDMTTEVLAKLNAEEEKPRQ
jgi:Skp family chaperone for outer membrane proteins